MIFGNKPPYTTMQQLNLDWVLSKLKTLLRLVPDNGAVGQILRRTRDGAEWSDETGGGGAVSSVNGQTGEVVLDAADVGALPDSYEAPVTSVNGETGDVEIDTGVMSIEFVRQDGQTGTIKMADSFVIRSLEGIAISANSAHTIMLISANKSTIGLGNVDNVRQYSASNPPPYPVTSVNGQTGAVVIPTGGGAVDSVNGMTGTVVLGKSDVGLANVDNVQQYSADNPPPYPVTSVNGQTGAVVIPTGGGVEFVKLWENSSPTASFAAQNVSVDLSSYAWFAVKYRFSTSTVGDYPLSFFEVDDHQKIIAISASGNNRTGGRSFTYSPTNKVIAFGGASYNGSANNANAIPVAIYGIGGVTNV